MGVLMAYVFEAESFVYGDLRAYLWLVLLFWRHGCVVPAERQPRPPTGALPLPTASDCVCYGNPSDFELDYLNRPT